MKRGTHCWPPRLVTFSVLGFVLMRRWVLICGMLICGMLILSSLGSARDRKPLVPLPTLLEIGRHTFFDFGPPMDYYELFLVNSADSGTLIERITLTPAVDVCTQPAKIETKSTSTTETIESLLAATNPCTIPEKKLHRELKRCKKCLVFSGVIVRMRVECGTQSRIIRSDILDKDMFDPAANTPKDTSWTLDLLTRLDEAVGPGVMEKPVFPVQAKDEPANGSSNNEAMENLRSGKYDALFEGAPDKPSELYTAAQIRAATPAVRLVASSPFQPDSPVLPGYPPLARVARVEGKVVFEVTIDPNGKAANLTVEAGNPLLRAAVEKAVSEWQFSKEAAHQQIQAAIEFKLNCPTRQH